jgi:hypothetical protein
MMFARKNSAVDQSEADLIDQHLFVESIAICAFEINYTKPEPSNIEKVCFILEKMN